MMPAEPADFTAAGLLEGLEGDAREQRLALLDWLAGRGFELGQLQLANDFGLLPFVAADRVIGGPRELTAGEVATTAGVDLELYLRTRRVQGLPAPPDPQARIFSALDLRAAESIRRWQQLGLSDEQIVQSVRAIGSNIARAAEAIRTAVLEIFQPPGSDEHEIAEYYEQTTELLMPLLDELTIDLMRQHLRNMVETDLAWLGDAAGGVPMAVAFADLVGFTRLGAEVEPEALGRLADRLVELAEEHVEPPVRLVKTIGDALLLTSPDSTALVATGLRLCAAVEDAGEDVPRLRVGIAHGPVVTRAGDVFGAAVNVANRITGIARAGTVVATEEVRSATADAFSWSSLPPRRLKGISRPLQLSRARPAA